MTRITGKNLSLLLTIISEINCATSSKVDSIAFCHEFGVKYKDAFCSPLQ